MKYLGRYNFLQIADAMTKTVGQVLRSMREDAGIPRQRLADLIHQSLAQIDHLENGIRKLTTNLAVDIDGALGTYPLLTTLQQIEGDTVKRRTLVAGITAGLAAGPDAMSVFAAHVHSGLLDAIDEPQDWDSIVADYTRRLVVDPSPMYGSSLLVQQTVARQHIGEYGQSPELLRAVAELTHLYGLWLGNVGDLANARGWHRTAIVLADRSTDTPTEVFIRARWASRGIYEGSTVRETLDQAQHALALSSRPSMGAVEAYSARVHVAALTDNLSDGRNAVIGMRNVVDSLPDDVAGQVAGAAQRTATFDNYLECRSGSWLDAQRAFEAAEPVLRSAPLWLTDAKMYFGRAIVASGDVAGGIAFVLAAIKDMVAADVRSIAVGVSDVLSVVPTSFRSDELDELRSFAATGPMPWDTLA